ncbi:programmed cell death protein 10-like isoform X1 [Mustelus asterias]
MGTAPAIANPTVTMALYTVMYPVFSELEEVHSAAAQNLKAIFTEAEMKTPGLCQELLLKLLEQESVDLDVSYTEALLRMSGQDAQGPLDQGEEREELSELRKKGRALRNILSSIADDINEKKRFMLTIRVSAVAIKDLLTTVSDMIKEFPPSMHQDLIHRRREFLIASKSFSDTLKKYFRDHRSSSVIVGALNLVHQINSLVQAFAESMPTASPTIGTSPVPLGPSVAWELGLE